MLRNRLLRPDRAFSLVELLVVIGIIAVLIGILMPTLSRAREQATTVQCLANLHNLGLALVGYTQGNRDRFPTSSHSGETWLDLLAGHGATVQARRCPVDKDPNRAASYSTNDYFEEAGMGAVSTYPTFTRWSKVPHPTASVYAADARGPGLIDHLHAHYQGWVSKWDVFGPVDVTLHRRGANYLFVDGHADHIPWKRFDRFDELHNPFNPTTANGF